MKRLFTSEAVTEGHPDKVCDRISDAILDEVLRQDLYGKVACECTVTKDFVLVVGELRTSANIDVESIVKEVIREIGYTDEKLGFDDKNVRIMNLLHKQSDDIHIGVARSTLDDLEKTGAGDQGIMFGYACDETKELMPLSITLANQLAGKLAKVRKSGELGYLRPDGKTQVTVEYESGQIKRIHTILISTQHTEDVGLEQIKKDLFDKVVRPVVPSYLIDKDTIFLVNPTGRFVVGGPSGDSGLTGRKIIVDTYGGVGRHGGGAFSGKDPTKVDRSGAYMARWIAKHIVGVGLAYKCEVQLSYAIGMTKPLSVFIDTFGTGKVSDQRLIDVVIKVFDLRPEAIIRELDLRKPIYKNTSSYGHFGRSKFPWEKLTKAESLLKELQKSFA